jgi:signal peptidase II
MKKKLTWLFLISGIIIVLDQITKIQIYTHFQLGESVSVIKDLFNITYVRNFGAAFGFLAQTPPEFRDVFFLIMPPVALITILLILKGVDSKDNPQILALSSIFGGAIGNYIDRLRFGYVIDFLDFHYKNQYNYPAFNIADSAIVLGVGVLFLLMFLEERRKKSAQATLRSL